MIWSYIIEVIITREHVSTQRMLASDHVSTQDTLAFKQVRQEI